MFYRLSITLIAVAFLATAATLKTLALVRDGGPWPVTDALLIAGEGVLAITCGLFLFGRATGWVLSLTYLALGNVALYYAFAEKPCGCLGATKVSPWLMAGVDFALALSLLIVAGWTPWPNGRSKWATALAAAGSFAVVVAVGAAFGSSRYGVSETPPPIVDVILESIRKNYEGMENEQYTLTMHLVQPAMPKMKGIESPELIFPTDITLASKVHRRDGLVCTTCENNRLVTDGRLNLQYSAKSKTAWIRVGTTLGETAVDPRNLGLPAGWVLTSGSTGAATRWRQITPSGGGPGTIEISFRLEERSYEFNVVFDPALNRLPVSITTQSPDGLPPTLSNLTYAPVADSGRFRLDTIRTVVQVNMPDGGSGSLVRTYKVSDYQLDTVADQNMTDFRLPPGARIIDTVSGVQRKAPIDTSELFGSAMLKIVAADSRSSSRLPVALWLTMLGVVAIYISSGIFCYRKNLE